MTTAVLLFLWLASIATPVPAASGVPVHDPPPEGAIVLFDGKGLDAWVGEDGKAPARWPVVDGILGVGRGSIRTARSFGDVVLHVEFNVPYEPESKGPERGIGGVVLAGAYEVRILDSYGQKPGEDGCGAVPGQVAPRVNVCRPPLQWQTFEITFHKPTLVDGREARKARITVVHNGINVINNAEIRATPGGESARPFGDGPVLLPDRGHAVEFRNIWVKPL